MGGVGETFIFRRLRQYLGRIKAVDRRNSIFFSTRKEDLPGRDWWATYPQRGVFPSAFYVSSVNGAKTELKDRQETTFSDFCNHDVHEQQASFQYASDSPRTQIHTSALQLGGDPAGMSAHTVGKIRERIMSDSTLV